MQKIIINTGNSLLFIKSLLIYNYYTYKVNNKKYIDIIPPRTFVKYFYCKFLIFIKFWQSFLPEAHCRQLSLSKEKHANNSHVTGKMKRAVASLPLVTSSPRTPVCVEDSSMSICVENSSMSIFPSLLGNLNKPINAIHDRVLSDGEIQKRQHRFGTVFFVAPQAREQSLRFPW